MNSNSLETSTRQYFQRVMHDWQSTIHVEHPYAHNVIWRRNYQALLKWIQKCNLQQGRVLEIGSGTGLLQHVVSNYVGTDLALSSAHYMYQPFCVCSATTLPFADNTFDGVWSVWVLEHIDDPERMLSEMRRVVKPGGSIFLCAAYAVDSWVSQGLHKRSFRELAFQQKLTKLTIPLRSQPLYKVLTTLPKRIIMASEYMRTGKPTMLQYGRLNPNYDIYWDYDADAVVSLDSYNIVLYFLSRGDKPLTRAGVLRSLIQRSQPQLYTIQKRINSAT